MKYSYLHSHEMMAKRTQAVWTNFSVPRTSYRVQLLSPSCTAEFCSVLGKDGLRYRLRTPCNSERSVFTGLHSLWTMYHSATELLSRHTSHTVHKGDWHHNQHLLVQNITRPVRIRTYIAIPGRETAPRHGRFCRVSTFSPSLAHKPD